MPDRTISRSAWFAILETLPLAHTASFIGLVLVVVFFVTSSDSGSLVIDTITAGGKLDTPIAQRVFWCVFEGLVAIALHGGQDRLTRHAHLSPAAFPGKVPVQKGTVVHPSGHNHASTRHRPARARPTTRT